MTQTELSEETVKGVLEGLLKNVYRAFDFRRERHLRQARGKRHG